ncbi:MAG: hypothetical protein PGN13_15685 [Patulibacter minatonensis]
MHPPQLRFARRRLRGATLAGLLAVAGSVAPGAATAAESVTKNACFYAIDGFWRGLDFRIAGAASPGYVPPGGGFGLKGAAIAAAFPDWIAEYGFNLGHLDAGPNAIKAHVWVAVDGKGSAQGTQVVKADVTANTTITASADGQKFVSATPLAVTVTLPDTTWTAPTDDGAAIDFTQGSPGQLPRIPGYGGASSVQPIGSIFIRAELSSSIAFDLDCLPGAPTADFKAYTRGAAPRFEVAYADPSAPPTGVPAPPVPSPAITVTSTSLKLKGGRRLSLGLANQGLITATGRIRVRTKNAYTLPGKRRARVEVLPWNDYELGSGDRATVVGSVASKARTLLKTRTSIPVVVETRAATGVRDARGDAVLGAAATLPLSLRR